MTLNLHAHSTSLISGSADLSVVNSIVLASVEEEIGEAPRPGLYTIFLVTSHMPFPQELIILLAVLPCLNCIKGRLGC